MASPIRPVSPSSSPEQGFALALMAALVIILSIIASSWLVKSGKKDVWDTRLQTSTQLKEIAKALSSFQRTQHRLPCVAPQNLALGGSIATTHSTLGAQTLRAGQELPGCNAGTTTNMAGTMRIDTGGGIYVRIGALPTMTLGLPDTMAEDAWKNRIIYAVRETLTNAPTFSSVPGNITVQRNGANVLTNAAYVLVSTGEDGKGAYSSQSGAARATCASSAGVDQENCDADAIFAINDTVLTQGAAYFDDIIAYDVVDTYAQSLPYP